MPNEIPEARIWARENARTMWLLAAIGYMAAELIPPSSMEDEETIDRHTLGSLLLPSLLTAYQTFARDQEREVIDTVLALLVPSLFLFAIGYYIGDVPTLVVAGVISLASQMRRNTESVAQRNVVPSADQRVGFHIGPNTRGALLHTLGLFGVLAGSTISSEQPANNVLSGGWLIGIANTMYEAFVRGEDIMDAGVRTVASLVPANIMLLLTYGLTESFPLALYASTMTGLFAAQMMEEHVEPRAAAEMSPTPR